MSHDINEINAKNSIRKEEKWRHFMSCYRGEVGVILANLSDDDFFVKKYDRIAQLVIIEWFC